MTLVKRHYLKYIKLILKLIVPPKIREPSVYMYFKLLYSINCLYKTIAEVSIIILKNIKIRKLQSEIESMDAKFIENLFLGMMVLIFFRKMICPQHFYNKS